MKSTIEIGGTSYEVEYSDGGEDYVLKVSYNDLSDQVKVKMVTFPYIYFFENDIILYIHYFGDEEYVIVPKFDDYENFYSSTLYSGNKTIQQIEFPEGIKIL